MGKPAARVSDSTTSPSGRGCIPITTGSPDVIIECSAAACKGDTSAWGSTITSGVSATVTKPEKDRRNKYANHMAMRGAIRASKIFQRITPNRVMHEHAPVMTDQTIAKYTAASDSGMCRAGNSSELAKYGVWD